MYKGEDNIPQQRLPLSKKTKKWKEECIEAFINISAHGTSERKDYLRTLYDYYNGVIEESDYRYVLKPYGKARKNFPSKMRNYPIIKPIIDLLLGEKSKRPLNYTVTVKNADTVTNKELAKQQTLYQLMEQMFINRLNEQGMETGVPSQEVELPQHILEQFERSYVDSRAIHGQKALNYIMYSEEIYEKLNKAWFDFLVTGEVYTQRGVRSNEPFYDILNPIDVDYDKDPDLEFVEDGDWALVRKFVHASTLIDHYYDELTEEQVLKLENPENHDMHSFLAFRPESTNADQNVHRSRLIEAITVYWKSRKRIGFLEFLDPTTGMIEEIEVDESFRMPKELKEQGAKLTWMWVNEVWEGTRIDGDIYVKMRAIPNQRISLDNPSLCKLPINGRKYSDRNARNISLVSLGIPYQLNYNIYKYRLELAIARSKDIIAQFDINMIPKKWDMDKFMYYVEGTGIAWVDYNKEGVTLSPQHQSVLDMSIKTIEQYIVLLNSIMEEWEKLSGVNRQRQGQVGNYEGKATSQQAIVQSSHITEDIFRKFNRLEQRDLQALIDYSKEAWINGKKSMYVMADGVQEFLSLDSMEHMESEYGIFVSDSGKDQDKLDAIKQLSQSMVQNGVPASTIAEMFDAESFTEIKSKIASAEQQMQALQQQQQEAEQQIQQAQLQQQQAEMENENMNKQKDRETDIEVAMIRARVDMMKVDAQIDKQQGDQQIKERQTDIQASQLNESSRAKRNEEGAKREDMRSRERQATADRQSKERQNRETLASQEKQAKENKSSSES